MEKREWSAMAKTLWNIGVAVVVAVPTLKDGVNGMTEWCLLIAALANALLVWVVPNMKNGVAKHAKGIVAVIVAATAIIPSLAVDGWNGADSFELVALVIGAVLTPVIPNKGYVYARKVASPLNG
jgi:hypothetical protein